jgi:hypothetical protein
MAKITKKQISLVKTLTYELIIDEQGQYYVCYPIHNNIVKLTDSQAKSLMINRIKETNNK